MTYFFTLIALDGVHISAEELAYWGTLAAIVGAVCFVLRKRIYGD
jgi:hypothetical protein